MKRIVSLLLVLVMVLSMANLTVFAADATVLVDVSGQAVTEEDRYEYTWTVETAGVLTVEASGDPAFRYQIVYPNGTATLNQKANKDWDLTELGTYTVRVGAYANADYAYTSGTVGLKLSFTPNEDGSEVPVEKKPYEISQAVLALGDNSVAMLETAVTTVFEFEPTEVGVYTFTVPTGAVIGYWGAGSFFLTDPGSSSNSCQWTCTSAGQSAFVGVSGVEGAVNVNVAKTGDYEEIIYEEVKYENKAQLSAFELPADAKLGSYVDVTEEHSAVLGTDGYYHLDSANGPILLVDMNYQDIILSAALNSDRPVMFVYTGEKLANGHYIKYSIGDAVKAYEAVMDSNGYYPLTEDLILFYDDYANAAGTYSFYLTGSYNEDTVWMYCMRTVDKLDASGTTEPSVPESSEPEPSEPESSEPETEPSEPVVSGVQVLSEKVTAEKGAKYVYSYKPETDGTLTVTVGDGSTNWSSDITYFVGVSMTSIASASGVSEGSYTAEVKAGTTYRIRVWQSSELDLAETPLTVSFLATGGTTEPDPDPSEPTDPSEPESSEPETEPSEPETKPSEPVDPSVPEGAVYAIVSGSNVTYYNDAAPASINAAIKAAPVGATFVMHDDIDLGATLSCFEIYAGTDLILDLNGHTLSYTYASLGGVYVDGGKLTIRDSSAGKSGMITNSNKYGIAIEINKGSVVFESGNASSATGVKVWGGTSFTCEGGTISGSQYAVNALANATLSISGGTLVSTAISIYATVSAASDSTAEITGGYFNGLAPIGAGLDGKISGGYFTKAPSATRIAEGCELVETGETPYAYQVVDPNAEPDFEPVAEINGTGYETFENALAAAVDGDTIKLLAGVVVDTDMTLDLTGKTLDGNGVYPAIRIVNDATLTVAGGSFTNTDYVFVLGASDSSSAGNLIIDAGTFHGATTVASVTKGSLTVNGGEFSVEPYEGSYAYLLNCVDANYADGTATITVNGGTFQNWNPADNAAEGTATDFVADTNLVANYQAGAWTVTQPAAINWIWNQAQTAATAAVTVPADATIHYAATIGGMELTINGELYGMLNGSRWTPEIFTITNNGTEPANYALNIAYPSGTMDNPVKLVMGNNVAEVETGNDQGYWFTWTAEEDGILYVLMNDVTDAEGNPLGWIYQVQNVTSGASSDLAGSDDEPVVKGYEMAVSTGDVVEIMVNTYNPADMWNNPAGTITVYASFTYPEGAEKNPIMLPAAKWNWNGNAEATLTVDVAPGETFYGIPFGTGMELFVDDVSKGTIEANTYDPYSLSIANDTNATVQHTLRLVVPVGAMGNPAALTEGENTASIAEGNNQGYYFSWTAKTEGTLIITMPEGDWQCQITNQRNSTQTNVNSANAESNMIEVEVQSGDELQIVVNSFDPQDANHYPEATIVLTAAFQTPVVECEHDYPAVSAANASAVCTKCGNEVFAWAGMAVSLESSLQASFVVQTSKLPESGYYAVIEKEVYDKETGEISIEATRFEASDFVNYNTSGTMKKIVFSGVAAKQMTDRFTVTIYNADDEQISASYTRTIEEYILGLLTGTSTKAAMKVVCVDFLNYGAAAQDKFNYRKTELANRGLTDDMKALATADSAVADVTDDRTKGALLAGTAVAAEYEIIPSTVYQTSKLTNVVKAEVSYVNFKGVTVSYEVAAADFANYNTAGTMKKIEIKGTAVADGASPITVKLIDANGNVVDETVECVNYYCARMAADHEVFTMLLKVIYSAKVAFA